MLTGSACRRAGNGFYKGVQPPILFIIMLLEQIRLSRPMFQTFERVTKESENVGDDYHLPTSPITKDEFTLKVNYWSYFNMMDVPQKASISFHSKARQMNLIGAMAAIRPYIKGRNYRLILQHLGNAIERYDTVSTK